MLFIFKDHHAKNKFRIFEISKKGIKSGKYKRLLVWAFDLMDYKHRTKKSLVATKLFCKFNRTHFLQSLERTEFDYFKLKFKIWNSEL